MTDKKHILKSASIISLVTIVSRILGYVREQRIALLLGTTPVADAYYLAYRIPNLFRRLVAEGSMTASFIPVFTTYMREKTKEEVWDFANKLFWTLALVVAVITVLGMVFSPQVVHLFAGKNIEGGQAVELNRIVFPYLFFIALAALAMGILNCFHVFGLPAATPVFLNLATIFFTFAAVRSHFKNAATAIVVGVLVGGVLQFLMQVPLLVQKGMKFSFGVSFSHPGIRNVVSSANDSAAVRNRHRTDQSLRGYAVCDGTDYADRKLGGSDDRGPHDGVGPWRIRHCRGDGHPSDDVASGGGERL